MSDPLNLLPRRRPEVQLKAVKDDEFVVKDRKTRSYFRIGPVEHFLLSRLDGTRDAATLRAEFERDFGEPLSSEDLDGFLEMVRGQGLLDLPADPGQPAAVDSDDPEGGPGGQSWLFFRRSVFDPDTLFTHLEPWIRFVWTRMFLLLSLMAIVLAGWTLWTSRADLMLGLQRGLRWETAVLIWLTLVLVTTLHEFAHGLTCKHYGGEVHEVGVLMIFFMPCFYCDISDAWLIPKKSQRLLVTLAGGYSDLCVWAVSVFLWRMTVPDSLLHYMTTIVLGTCGTRVFLNLNPFLRLDGYYLVGDWLEIPNLRMRARECWMGHLRWALWGAERPAREAKWGWMVAYGGAMWLMSIVTLEFLALGMWQFVLGRLGFLGAALGSIVLFLVSRRVFSGLTNNEVVIMLKTRPLRTAVWATLLVGGPIASFVIPWDHSAHGTAEVRSGRRVEVHAAVAGFMRNIEVEEGVTVAVGSPIAWIDVPDLDSLIRRKQSEIEECEATLVKLRTGARPEQLAEERQRVQRAESWVELARSDLRLARMSLEETMLQLDQSIHQSQTELTYAKSSLVRAEQLFKLGAMAGEQLRAERKKVMLLQSQVTQAEAQKRARAADGVRAAESELARREKELADARSGLKLLEAGSRPEDLQVETARKSRLEEELRYLEGECAKQKVVSPTAGVVSTPRMVERNGTYFEKGTLICTLEDMSIVQVEIAIDEDSIIGVGVGHQIDLKIRALPFDTFKAQVEKIAPAANTETGRAQNLVRVLCRVPNPDGKLKAGMTGFARINRGKTSLGGMLLTRGLKELRTEFWW